MNVFQLSGLHILVLFLAFTSPLTEVQQGGVDIRGRVTKIRRTSVEKESKIIGTVLVEGDKKVNKSLDQANLIVTNKTRLFLQRGEQRLRARFEDLKVGDTVEAKFIKGPTFLIYPLQVGAAEILIMNTGVVKE